MRLVLKTNTTDMDNDICDSVRAFTGADTIDVFHDETISMIDRALVVLHEYDYDGKAFINNVQVLFLDDEGNVDKKVTNKHVENYLDSGDKLLFKRFAKRSVKNAIYLCMQKALPKNLPWGSLTGIRPTRMVYEMQDRGLNKSEIKTALANEFFINSEKADLLINAVEMQKPIVETQTIDKVDIYISIPFCVSRCVYCSFPAHEIDKNKEYVNSYLQALDKEIQYASKIIKQGAWRPRALYIGGGTPTSISADQLERLIQTAFQWFGEFSEVTVEAGRPDTLDNQKLEMLKKNSVDRISINPQTMNAKTLELIGRNHSPQDTINAFEMARAMGFDWINTDLILGLPGESTIEVEKTLSEIEKLRPENVTVHTLAIKRASKLRINNLTEGLPSAGNVAQMVDVAKDWATSLGYHPYYLYRQKYMTGNFENVGYCLPHYQCVYNIDTMEDTVSNLALGAGAISKRVFKRELRVERLPNPKSLEHYINRIDEHIQKKSEFFG